MEPVEANRRLAIKHLEDMSRHDFDACAANWAEEASNHGRQVGRDAVLKVEADILATFPDWRPEIHETVAEGDWVVCRITLSGTHLGTNTIPHHNIPVGTKPTGRTFSAQVIHIFRMADGHLVEHRAGRDDVTVLRQLGLMEPPASAPSPAPPQHAMAEASPHGQPAELVEANRRLAIKQLEDLNRHDLDACIENWAEDAGNHGSQVGRDGLRRVQADILATFPDWHQEIHETLADSDWVVCRVTATGTHLGTNTIPHHNIPPGTKPTGLKFSAQIIHMWRIEDGHIAEHFAGRDDVTLLRQLGLFELAAP